MTQVWKWENSSKFLTFNRPQILLVHNKLPSANRTDNEQIGRPLLKQFNESHKSKLITTLANYNNNYSLIY